MYINIEREKYFEAEKRVVTELAEINKPFIVILNTTRQNAESTINVIYELTNALLNG